MTLLSLQIFREAQNAGRKRWGAACAPRREYPVIACQIVGNVFGARDYAFQVLGERVGDLA
jgi:hypothetical protein